MINRCNIIALVGGGQNTKYTPNKVIIWDDSQAKIVSEIKFSYPVKNVKLKKEQLIVVCESKIYIFSLINFTSTDVIETMENPRGLIASSNDPKLNIIAFPDSKVGNVRVKFFESQRS